MTAFVDRVLRQAVIEANDRFAGLAADLARNLRFEIRSAIEDGGYREAPRRWRGKRRGRSRHR